MTISTNPISPYTLLDCLQEQQLITAEGMSDLRSTLKDLGYGGAGVSLPTCNIDDVLPIAEKLVASGHAVWLHSNWLKITPAGMVAEGFNDELESN